MMNSLKMRLMCTATAGAVILGSFAYPVSVMARDYYGDYDFDFDDDDDYDYDDDDYISDEEAEEIAAMIVLAAVAEAEEESNSREVTGICVSSTDVTLTQGDGYKITAYVKPDNARNQRVRYYSTNSGVASVDSNGYIRANNPGSCTIVSESDERGYEAHTCVRVNPAAAVQISSAAPSTAPAANPSAALVMAAAPYTSVNLTASKSGYLDADTVAALRMRPDVSALAYYTCDGHTYAMSIPAGYNLTARLDNTGKVSLPALAAANDGSVIVTLIK